MYDVIKKNKRLEWTYWPPDQDTIKTPGDSRYPSIAEGELTVWSEGPGSPPVDGWEIYYQRDDEPPQNLSNTPDTVSRFSHPSRRQTKVATYLYTVWTEGNEPPYRILNKRLTFPSDTFRAFYTATVGGEEPSMYTVQRSGYIASWGYPVDYSESNLIYKFPYFDPEMIYEIEAEFYHEGPGTWIAKVFVDDNHLGTINYAPGNPERARFTIPAELYADSTVTVRFEKLTGERVTLSALRVYQYEQEEGISGGPMSSGLRRVTLEKPVLKVKPSIFRSEIEIQYTLPTDGRARIHVYGVTGRRIAALVDEMVKAGSHNLKWNGKLTEDRLLPQGVYFIRLETPTGPVTQKVILLR